MTIRVAFCAALVACGGGKPAVAPPAAVHAAPPKPQAPSASALAVAGAVAHVYQVLAVDSAVPADPKELREAALDALAPEGYPGTVTWTDDPAKDGEVLRDAIAKLATKVALPGNALMRAARAMSLATNDPHTFALAKPALRALLSLVDGAPVVQAGMLYHELEDGRWAVSDVLANSPAAAAGVVRGDILVSLDGIPVTRGWMDFAPLLGAPNGYEAMLVVERGSEKKGLVLRMAAVTPPIVESKVLAGGIGYVRIWVCARSEDPARDAAKQLAAALAEFDKKRVKKLVIDLRGNLGGTALDVASLLVDADPLVVAIAPDGTETPLARPKLPLWKTKRPIAVIVNELTASGGEMIALALRDYANAKIVGRPTAGAMSTITSEQLSSEVTLSFPASRVRSAKTKLALEGNRIDPDLPVANPTAEDYAAGRDPQLDAAIVSVKAMH